MEEYSNLKMTMENRKQAIEAVEIIKNLASKRTPESPNELIHYLADVKIKKNMVIVDNSCSLFSNTFLELTSDIMKSCASLTKNSFTANAWFTSCNCGYQACIDAERNGNNVELTTIVGEDGCCPECGVQVVNYDEYDPNETYYCPECGKEVDHLEMFDGRLPQVVKESFVIK